MKVSKKITAAALALAMIFAVLAGCVSSETKKDTKTNAKSETVITDSGRQREVYSILPEGIAYYQSFLVSYVKQIESVNHLLNIVK